MMNKPDFRNSGRFIRDTARLLVFCLIILLLTGCWDRMEINDLAFVMGAAIDQKSEGLIELSVQVFIPKSGGGAQSTSSTSSSKASTQEQTMVRSAEGVSVADAISHLQERLPRELFWGHNEIYIFGHTRAEQGIREDIDFMLRSSQPRERANVFVSKGKAKDTLKLMPPLERNSSEVLRELSKFHIGMDVTLLELSEMLTGDTNTAVLPLIVTLPSESGKPPTQTISYIHGSAILKNAKMIGEIDIQATRGILWLRDEIKSSIFTVAPEQSKGYISLRMIRSSTQLIPQIMDGIWSMRVQIEADNDVQQNTTGKSLMDPDWLHTVEDSVDKAIQERLQIALKPAQKKLHADIFRFADAFHRKYPKEWSQAKDHWSEVFSSMKVEVISHSRIRRPGVSNNDATSAQKGVDS
jgi:spore germination protein KC